MILVIGIVVVLAVIFFVFNRSKQSNNTELGIDQDANAKTTSTSPTAQEGYTDGNDRPIQETNREKGDAVISDNQGSISQIPEESSWTTSSTGQITLYSPSKNQLIKNGGSISGQSSLSAVSFRIIDDVSGEISTGQLSVVNGKFSGIISFSTTASEGRLDIFGTKSDGGEFSNVEVPVRFK